MKIILIMSFSGSTMFLGYLLVKRLFKSRLPDKMLYFLFKASVLYYLTPLLFLKPTFSKVGNFLNSHLFQISVKDGILYTYRDKYLVLETGKGYMLNAVFREDVWAAVVWSLVGLAVIGVQIAKYYMGKKERAKMIWKSPSNHDEMLVQRWVSRYRMKRPVKLLPASGEIPSFTQGFLHPVICYSAVSEDDVEREMQLQHELVHIRNKDLLWNILVRLVLCLHWYNPLTWLLYKEWHVVSEDTCDSEVLLGRTACERAVYARMLIRESQIKETPKVAMLSVSLTGNVKGKRDIERRVNKIMNKKVELKGIKKVAVVFAVTMLVMLNSLTAYAYEDVQYRVVESETVSASADEAEFDWDGDWIFVEAGHEDEREGYWAEIYEDSHKAYVAEWQFIDEDGNVYPIDWETNSRLFCPNHAYVYGEIQQHTKLDDGSCIVKTFEGARCTICGSINLGALLGTATFNPCTHE